MALAKPMRVLASLALLIALLAGCASPAGETVDPLVDEAEFEGLAASSTTGVIRGVVVDEAIRPISAVLVQLTGNDPRNTTTTDEGLFGFDGLEPGTYFLQVGKPGFKSVQQSADVVAGDAEPPIVKVLLLQDAATAPFVEAQVYDGYIECTTSVLVLCGIAGVLTGQQVTNDRFAWDQYFADNASLLQAEMVWESTQPLSPELYFEMETLNSGCESKSDGASSFLNSTRGPSPIYATVNQTQIDNWAIGQACPVWMSLFSGGISGAPCLNAVPDPAGAVPGWCLGATVQQRFAMYFHGFYNHLPNPGWRFTVDGPPAPPA